MQQQVVIPRGLANHQNLQAQISGEARRQSLSATRNIDMRAVRHRRQQTTSTVPHIRTEDSPQAKEVIRHLKTFLYPQGMLLHLPQPTNGTKSIQLFACRRLRYMTFELPRTNHLLCGGKCLSQKVPSRYLGNFPYCWQKLGLFIQELEIIDCY